MTLPRSFGNIRPFSLARAALLVGLATSIGAACGGMTDDDDLEATGSETHFLIECPESCGPDLSCIGGVCTSECTDDATCSALDAASTCAIDLSTSAGVCDVECELAADCAGLGPGYGCVSGACRGAAASSDAALGKPARFDLLELRRVGEEAAGAGSSCDPLPFTKALYVERAARTLSWQGCDDSETDGLYVADSGWMALSDADIAQLDAGFDMLEPVVAGRRTAEDAAACRQLAGIITLDVTVAAAEAGGAPAHVGFADADHAECPIARLNRDRFIGDLVDLYEVLASIASRRE